MTPNEATLVGAFGATAVSAVVSAVVSWRVAVYTLKRGPDYQKQLNNLSAEMGRVSAAQEGMLAHHKEAAAEERARREAQAWRPGRVHLKSDPKTRTNTLTILSDRHFSLEKVAVLTNSGATVATVPVTGDHQNMVLGLNFPIPQEPILALVGPDPDYRRYGKTVGKLVYELSVGLEGNRLSFELPFRAMQEISDNTVWTSMEG